MAIAVYSADDKRYGYAQQLSPASFGTAVLDSAAVNEVDCEHFNIARDTKIRIASGAHASRSRLSTDITGDVKRTAPSFTVGGELKLLDLPEFLYAHFQSVTEGIATPYDKTFVYPTTQPDFSVDGGYFATWFERLSAASRSWKAIDCISKALSITAAPGERVKFSQEWVGRGSPAVNANPSGTWTRTAQTYFNFEDIAVATINFGGGDVSPVLKGFEINLTQEVLLVGQDGSGSFQTFGIPRHADTFSITILEDANTTTAVTNLDAGTEIDVRFGWGNATPGTVNGDFDIQFYGKIENVELDNEDVFGTTITGTITAQSITGAPITIIMADAVDKTW